MSTTLVQAVQSGDDAIAKPVFDPLPLVPAELKALSNWVTFESKDKKAPIISGTFENAASNNPATWVPYSVACENIRNGKGYTGLGFVTDGGNSHNLVGFDLDGCRNPATGELTDWSMKIKNALPPTYGEITVSGTGLRFWVIADFPKSVTFKMGLTPIYNGKNQKLEIFGDGLYFTVSGQRLDDLPSTVATLDADLMEDVLGVAQSLAVEEKQLEKSALHQDEGFKKLAEVVGWAPLINRMKKMSDARFHDLTMEPGQMIYCPMPQHQPRGEHLRYTPCFGALKDEPTLAHCFGCDFSGDVVKAVFEFDAGEDRGRIQYLTMYDCARAICVEYGLNFHEFFPMQAAAPAPLAVPNTAPITEENTDPIPPFDPSVMNGIYRKFVDVAIRGTTMTPQFVYTIAKTVVGARMAGKVKFENLDVEPRYYAALIGETGSGKGEAWRRVFQILNVEGQIGNVAGLKIINSADSGAGIRDAFFEPPESAPMLMYIDEVESFGNKAAATRNPAIMDMLIELADSTHVSSVKASRGKTKGTKTKTDARLCAVMCGQEGSVYMKAFAGRTKLGLWDRLTPEYGVAVEAGDLPPILTGDAYQLLIELNQLDYSGTMTMQMEAKTRLEAFWSSLQPEVKKKARWKKNLTLDVYMSAFGRGLKIAEVEDVEIAIKIFTRQLVIRQTHFTTEVPDRIGYYIGLLKTITAKMERQLAAGTPEGLVAKSRRDFERDTHAHRDNETHVFEKAWQVYSGTWLEKREVTKANGQKYWKYLPATDG